MNYNPTFQNINLPPQNLTHNPSQKLFSGNILKLIFIVIGKIFYCIGFLWIFNNLNNIQNKNI